MTMSVAAAKRVLSERVRRLGPDEVIRVRDAGGALVLSTDPTE
jgi:hypothetical protein